MRCWLPFLSQCPTEYIHRPWDLPLGRVHGLNVHLGHKDSLLSSSSCLIGEMGYDWIFENRLQHHKQTPNQNRNSKPPATTRNAKISKAIYNVKILGWSPWMRRLVLVFAFNTSNPYSMSLGSKARRNLNETCTIKLHLTSLCLDFT